MPQNPLPNSGSPRHAKSAIPVDQSHFRPQSNPSSRFLPTLTADLSFKPRATVPAQSATALMAYLTTLARLNASAQILSRLTAMPLFPTRSHHPCTKRYRADGPPHYPCQDESLPPAFLT